MSNSGNAPNPPLVSICLPVFNGQAHLAAAIESALNQTERDFELIIADDNSTDQSWSIINTWKEQDSRLRTFRNEPGLGLFQNYNRCMAQARGEYIKLFAQDDLLAPDALKTMIDVLSKNPEVVLVTTGKNWVDDEGNVIKTVVQFPEDRCIDGREAILDNLSKITNWVGEPSTALFRRQTAAQGFDTEFFHWGDLDYWFAMLRRGHLFYVASPLVSFRRHQRSASSSNLKGLYFVPDIYRLGDKYRDILAASGETAEQYKERAVKMIAMEVKHLIDDESLTDEEVGAVKNRARDGKEWPEYTAFRKALFHSSAEVAKLLAEMHIARETIRFRDKEIEELKNTVSGITSSKVWKLTAGLRSLSKRS